METLGGLNEKNLKKRIIVFDFEDVLINGAVEKNVKKKKAQRLLENLSALEKKIPGFRVFLVSGYRKEQGMKKLSESGFRHFFRPENVFFVEKKYVESMEKIDQQRYSKQISKDSLFQDDYFKQTILKKIADETGNRREQMVFVCHDLLTDAYYSQRFSKVDIALVKKSLSLKHEKAKATIKGLVYVQLDWHDFRKLLLGKKPKPDYAAFNTFIERYLQRELVGGLQVNASALFRQGNN